MSTSKFAHANGTVRVSFYTPGAPGSYRERRVNTVQEARGEAVLELLGKPAGHRAVIRWGMREESHEDWRSSGVQTTRDALGKEQRGTVIYRASLHHLDALPRDVDDVPRPDADSPWPRPHEGDDDPLPF